MLRMSNFRARWAVLLCTLLCGSCGGGSSEQACVPGAQVACACPGGGTGVQVCNDEGSKLGPCTACPAGTDAGPDAGPTLTETEFCHGVAKADCVAFVVAGCYAGSTGTPTENAAACVAAREQTSHCNPSGLPYHPEHAEDCIAAHASVYGSWKVDTAGLAKIEAACVAVYNKGGIKGSVCTVDLDCDAANGLRCVVRVGGQGACQVPDVVPPGASCAAPDTQCPDGYFCETTLNCVQKPGLGGICGDGQPCAVGFRCNDTEHKCEAQLPNGSTCADAGDCIAGLCEIAVAGAASGKCATALAFGVGSLECAPFTQP
jgi:hypothetical protein